MSASSSVTSANQLELEQAQGFREKIVALSQDFLDAFGLTHVWVAKMYFDGRYLDLTNDISWKEKMVHHQFYPELLKHNIEPLKLQNSKPIFSGWQADSSSHLRVYSEIYNHGIKSGVSMTITCSDHVEHYSFGSDKEILVVNGNLPNHDELMMFYLYLRESILQDKELQNPILGDSGYRYSITPESPESKRYIAQIPSSFSFTCNNRTGKLSRQKIICLSLLAKGLGHKEIALLLNLSPRTVECYINQIKNQYGNPTTSKLLSTFNDSPLAGINPHMLHASK